VSTFTALISPLALISPDAVMLPDVSKNNPFESSDPVTKMLTPAA